MNGQIFNGLFYSAGFCIILIICKIIITKFAKIIYFILAGIIINKIKKIKSTLKMYKYLTYVIKIFININLYKLNELNLLINLINFYSLLILLL